MDFAYNNIFYSFVMFKLPHTVKLINSLADGLIFHSLVALKGDWLPEITGSISVGKLNSFIIYFKKVAFQMWTRLEVKYSQ